MDRMSPFHVMACPTCRAPTGSPCVAPVEVAAYGAHEARSAAMARDLDAVLRWAKTESRAAGKPDWRERMEIVRRLHGMMAQSHDTEDENRALRAFQEALKEAAE